MQKNILVIGAGYAGVLTTKKLAKKFKKNNEINITLVDKNPFHTMLTELHEVAAYRVEEGLVQKNSQLSLVSELNNYVEYYSDDKNI